ncbi:hypothetical protein VE02_01376 [Pseudogymnoascus sp. 03VT05]|nr:hypothetical protein VE02_01376 [Pseudogymnoascus sp. 03VT05]
MKTPQEYPVMWFIDALDECKDDEVLKLVKVFENIGHTAVSSGSPLHICLSTRHYPNIPIRWGVKLTLEKQHGHDQDIITYINSEFRAPYSPHVARIKSELCIGSSGVFIWVRLVVELLNMAFRRGEGKPAQLQQLLDSVPEELDDLFTNILKSDPNSKDKSILCFQWVLFSKRPLNPEELYFAVIGIENFILNISKVLVEVTKTDRTVQFIHESVRDFLLLHDGFTKLEPNFAINVRGFSEERLKQCCYQYMILGVFKDSHWGPTQKTEPNPKDDILRHFPLAWYAVQYVFAHAEVAQSCDIDQREFLTDFEAPDRRSIQQWMMVYNDFSYNPRGSPTVYHPNDSLIYILSNENLPDLLLNLIQIKGNVNDVGRQHGSPLQLAAGKGYLAIAQHLIAAGADIDFPGDEPRLAPLFSAKDSGHVDVALLLLESGARYDIVTKSSQTPLIMAAIVGLTDVVQKLLQLGADINIEGGRALQTASNKRDWQIVRLLLQFRANVKFVCENDGNALQAAAFAGNYEIVQLLLQSGADANSGGGRDYSDALYAAAVGGSVQVVRLLLQWGAHVNSGNRKLGSALEAAAKHGNTMAVQMLLDTGADVNSIGGTYSSALEGQLTMGMGK